MSESKATENEPKATSSSSNDEPHADSTTGQASQSKPRNIFQSAPAGIHVGRGPVVNQAPRDDEGNETGKPLLSMDKHGNLSGNPSK